MALRARTAAGLTLLLAGVLATWSPRVAFGPGRVAPGHTRLSDDCLACHAPLRGVPAERCLKCHPTQRIGLDAGGHATRPAIVRLHRALGSVDCLACHSEHRDEPTPRFDHALLPPDQRQACAACHRERRPDDGAHRQAGDACGNCHTPEAWRPARVDHARLPVGMLCGVCHARRRPNDRLHADAGDACGACHRSDAWSPATFAHERFFVLDRDHAVACRTCHDPGRGFAAYTCYGCHAHTPAGVQAEHAEEGLRDIERCVRCHRSADEREASREHDRGGRRRRDHDD
jgi:hypothetical protein